MKAYFDGIEIGIDANEDFTAFSFIIPASSLAAPDLKLLKVTALDELGNENADIQSALVGRFAKRKSAVKNALGLGLGPEALSAFAGLIEEQVEAMDGSTIKQTVTQSGVTVDVLGFPSAIRRKRAVEPGFHRTVQSATSRWGCNQDVKVTMGIDAAGHIDISMTITSLFVDLYMHPIF
jgi:hypothetical protein